MQAQFFWELFEKTGNIGVYILYKKAQNEEMFCEGNEKIKDADKNRGHCN